MSVSPASAGNNFLQPRALAYVNGIFLPSWDIEVQQTAYDVADTITVKSIVSAATTDFGKLTQDNKDPLQFTVLAGAPTDPNSYNAESLTTLMTGVLDEIDTDYDTDEMEFRGRGLLALISDARTTQKVNQNVDVGDAIRKLITDAGLKADVQSAGIKVGRILTDDFVMIGRNIRVLEYLNTLATGVGWITRVKNGVVIVGPPPNRNEVPLFIKQRGGAHGTLKCRITHSALHAHDIKVRVVSYLPKSKTKVASGQVLTSDGFLQGSVDPLTGAGLQAPTATSPAKSRLTGGRQTGFASGGLHFSRSEEYVFHIPGITAEEADRRAAFIQAEISRHEFVADFEFTPPPSELQQMITASPEFLIQLRGLSQSSHNQIYHPRKVTWIYSFEEGLKVQILAVNHDIPTNTGGQ